MGREGKEHAVLRYSLAKIQSNLEDTLQARRRMLEIYPGLAERPTIAAIFKKETRRLPKPKQKPKTAELLSQRLFKTIKTKTLFPVLAAEGLTQTLPCFSEQVCSILAEISSLVEENIKLRHP
ncbi:MAG: uncharacterized protein A8A55_0451 [Amphiamblys sp. WSBS2006]|nr:MAG: uncharacterized protein A8A55_0451 [Amphiamblys sp. WSBS2006]